MLKKQILFILFFVLCVVNRLFSQHVESDDVLFIQNKGQWNSKIEYKADFFGGTMFCENDGLTFVLKDISDVIALKDHTHKKQRLKTNSSVKLHSYKMQFVGANYNPKISSFEKSTEYFNFFLSKDPKNWASKVYGYKKLEYSNIYKNIDFIVYPSAEGVKYDFVINPGGNLNDIIIDYKGQDNIRICNDNLEIKTQVETITEVIPCAYQVIYGDTIKYKCKYELKDNKVSFIIPDYNKKFKLVIDPILIFASYSGSTVDNWGYTATYDDKGFLYSGGVAFGTGYPSTLGFYQENFAGGVGAYPTDIVISKYDTTGNFMVYSTYLGGAGDEIPNSLIVNNLGELLIYGTTCSVDYPVTNSAYDTTFNGGTGFVFDYVLMFNGSDIVITKLSSNGENLLASTFVGGSNNDGFNSNPNLRVNYADEVRGDINFDLNNNVYVASSTQSTDFPTTSGCFQPSFGGGTHDGFVLKMDANLSNLLWCSYIGGDSADAAYSIRINKFDDIYLVGGTVSRNFPITAGTVQQAFSGGSADGYITKIRGNGNAILASTYYGSDQYDQLYLMDLDRFSNVYAFGQTRATDSTLVKNALWNTPGAGQVVCKLSSNLDTIIWSTVFGKANQGPDISPAAFMVDLCNKIYLTGWGGQVNNPVWGNIGGNTLGLPITFDAYQNTTDGSDFYLLVINDDASNISYGSFFGGGISQEHVDGGTSRFDKKGRVYQSVCAGCGGNDDFPVTTIMNQNNSSNCNNGVFKFDFKLPLVIADFDLPNIGCAPYTVSFNNTSQGASMYSWDFGDGFTSTLQNPTHVYSLPGNYTIMLAASNPGTCNEHDTIYKQLLVLSNNPSSLPQKEVCLGTCTQIGYTPNQDTSVHYTWTPIAGLSDPNVCNPVACPTVTTTYIVNVSNGVCSAEVQQIVKVYDLQVEAGPDTNVCFNNFSLIANSHGEANSYLWSSNNAYSDMLNPIPTDSIANANISSGSHWYYVKASSSQCDAYDSVFVTLRKAGVNTDSSSVVCVGDTASLHASNLIAGDFLTYHWTPEANVISGQNTNSISVVVSGLTDFVVVGTNQYGCLAFDSVQVKISNPSIGTIKIGNNKCFGDCEGWIKIVANGGFPNYSYSWSNGFTSDSVANLCQGLYKVTVSDFYSCESVEQITVSQPDSLHLSLLNHTDVVCNGLCDASAQVGTSGGIPPYSYLWNDGQVGSSISNLCWGNYIVTVTDSNSCTKQMQVSIRDTSTFEAHLESKVDPSCYHFCDGNALVNASSGLLPYVYNWSNSESTNFADSLCNGNYFVSVTDANNCLRKVFVTITEPAQLLVESDSIRDASCYNYTDGYAKLNIIGGTPLYSYNWNNIYSGDVQTSLADGVYNVTITDAKGCLTYDTITINQPTPLVLSSDTNKTTCLTSCDGQAWVFASGSVPSYTYLWNNSDTTNTINGLCAGSYDVTVTDQHNCKEELSLIISAGTYILPVTAEIMADTIYESQSVQLVASPSLGCTYIWSPAEIMNNSTIYNPIATPGASTSFQVTVTDALGCANTANLKITVNEVNCDEPDIFIPNAFSPDSDGFNDVLFVRGNVIENLYFAIYDRWGELVFETTDKKVGWDGTYRGKNLDPAVFVYYVEAGCISKEKFFKKGNITLIR